MSCTARTDGLCSWHRRIRQSCVTRTAVPQGTSHLIQCASIGRSIFISDDRNAYLHPLCSRERARGCRRKSRALQKLASVRTTLLSCLLSVGTRSLLCPQQVADHPYKILPGGPHFVNGSTSSCKPIPLDLKHAHTHQATQRAILHAHYLPKTLVYFNDARQVRDHAPLALITYSKRRRFFLFDSCFCPTMMSFGSVPWWPYRSLSCMAKYPCLLNLWPARQVYGALP